MVCLTSGRRNWAWRAYWTCRSSRWVMGKRWERGSLEPLWRPLKHCCWTSRQVSAFAFCFLPFSPSLCCPIVVHLMPYRIFLPSVSSFLPFYFFLAFFRLAYLSALFLFLLALFLFLHKVLRVSSSSLHFWPSSSLPYLLTFFPAPPLSAPLILLLTPLSPAFIQFGPNPPHAPPRELHVSRAPRILMVMRVQEEIPGWVINVLDVGG